jgi:hypothetical protein
LESQISDLKSQMELEAVFNEALRTVVRREPKPHLEARFYPYAGLSSTIRMRQGRVLVRVSDILRDAPREVLYSLACILIRKLYRLKNSKQQERAYRDYVARPAVLDASEATRRDRGYKIVTSPRGRFYDLGELFDRLNARYFGGQLERPLLSWSQRRTRHLLGHHDHIHGAIIISRTLDSPRIPLFVLEYVLYHEMLHVKHPPRVTTGRSIYHSASFRSDERRFERYGEAVGYLDRMALPTRRVTRKSRLRNS